MRDDIADKLPLHPKTSLLPHSYQDRKTVVQRVTTRGKPDAPFWLVRDDLLHPVIQGNKMRKLDVLLPKLCEAGVTDVVTCGGVQSAHVAAVAAACAEKGMCSHLLIRGERPAIPSGHYLLACMYGDVIHVTRSEYSDRDAMFAKQTELLKQRLPATAKVAVIEEGAAEPLALMGFVHLVRDLHLADGGPDVLRWDIPKHADLDQLLKRQILRMREPQLNIVIDSGTGTSAVGVALGIVTYGLPWKVTGIMLAGDEDYYRQQQQRLTAAFVQEYELDPSSLTQLPLTWVDRLIPRRFGKVLPGEIKTCKQVAQEHGILLDPVYTLAAWEMAEQLAQPPPSDRGQTYEELERYYAEAFFWLREHLWDRAERIVDQSCTEVVMLHTGGALGLHGLAQRFPGQF